MQNVQKPLGVPPAVPAKAGMQVLDFPASHFGEGRLYGGVLIPRPSLRISPMASLRLRGSL